MDSDKSGSWEVEAGGARRLGGEAQKDSSSLVCGLVASFAADAAAGGCRAAGCLPLLHVHLDQSDASFDSRMGPTCWTPQLQLSIMYANERA